MAYLASHCQRYFLIQDTSRWQAPAVNVRHPAAGRRRHGLPRDAAATFGLAGARLPHAGSLVIREIDPIDERVLARLHRRHREGESVVGLLPFHLVLGA